MPFCVSGVQITCFFMILGSLISCADWSTENDRVVARVGDVYLYSSDFEEELGDFIDETDSILKTRNYIDSWAKSQLFHSNYFCSKNVFSTVGGYLFFKLLFLVLQF